MKVNTNKKNVFKRVINIILAVLMGIVSVISVGVFTLACIGSCNSNTATVKADNSDVSTVASTDVFDFGTYFVPSCNLNKYTNESDKLNSYWYPNVTASSLNQTYNMACDISLVNFEYRVSPIGYTGDLVLPALDISCYNNVFSRVPLQPNILLKTGVDTLLPNVDEQRYIQEAYGEPLSGELGSNFNYNTFSNGVVYSPVYTFNYSSYFFGFLKYQFNPSFDCGNVRSLVYSSSVLYPSDFSSIFGSAFNYSYSMFINTLTFYDGGNNFFAIDFISSDAKDGGAYSYFMQKDKTVYFTPNLTDDDIYNDGYNQGYKDGYNQGNSDSDGSYQSGYENGYSAGESAGYSKGYQDGASGQLTYGGFFSNVLTIFDVPIFGFISLGDIFKFVFVIAMGIWALKLFAGG